MNLKTYLPKNTALQYKGYANTPLLWEDSLIMGLKQFHISTDTNTPFTQTIPQKMRLGYRVERFIGEDLRRQSGVKVLAENIQVQEKKQTIGELDCLLIQNGKPIHLEIIFKLYLYDERIGAKEIDYWIGGNRRDSLSKKLHKLKTKQLPLLYNPNTTAILDSYGLKADEIEQQVHFRAQLYVPFKTEADFKELNKECLKGFYIRPEQLDRFSEFRFFIPYRHDWLIDPILEVDWLGYGIFKNLIMERISYKSYPLCWVRYPDDSMQKFFVVWWD